MRKAIGTTLLGGCVVLILIGIAAIWNGSRVAENGFNLAWLLAGAVGTLLGLVGGFFTVKPRVAVEPLSTSFDDFPLELLFRVSNSGLFVLTGVKCEVSNFRTESNITAQPKTFYTHDPKGRLDRQEGPRTFTAIQPGHGDTLDIRKMIPLLAQQPDSATVLLTVSFRQHFWPLRSREQYRYNLFRCADRKYHWSEVSTEQPEGTRTAGGNR